MFPFRFSPYSTAVRKICYTWCCQALATCYHTCVKEPETKWPQGQGCSSFGSTVWSRLKHLSSPPTSRNRSHTFSPTFCCNWVRYPISCHADWWGIWFLTNCWHSNLVIPWVSLFYCPPKPLRPLTPLIKLKQHLLASPHHWLGIYLVCVNSSHNKGPGGGGDHCCCTR